MRRKCFIFLLCFVSFNLIGQSEYDAVDREKLSEILKMIEARNNVSFSFKNQTVDQFKISLAGGEYELDQILDSVFNQTYLAFQFLDEKHIAILDKDLSNTKLCGYLVDGLINEPLAFATVANQSKSAGVETDDRGYFEMPIAEGVQFLSASYLGYQTTEILVNKKALRSCLTYTMKRQQRVFEEITVMEYLDDGITIDDDANKIKMEPNEMNMLPGNVEKDIVSALQFLPGITSPNESLDRLYIRGGTPDQNLILWDDIPVYHSSHLFGSVTGFNPFIIESVDVYRNSISSRFGGRVSSVIDIKSKSNRPDKIGLGLGFNMTQTHLEFETPIGKNSSVYLTLRNSLTQGWSTPTFLSYAEKVFQGTKIDINTLENIENDVSFNDLTFKYIWTPGKNRIEFSALGSRNNLEYRSQLLEFDAFSIDALDLGHGGSKTSWERNWSDKLSSEVVLSTTVLDNTNSISFSTTEMPDSIPIFLETRNDLDEQNFRAGLAYKLSPLKTFRLGYQYTETKIDLSLRSRYFNEMSNNTQDFEHKLNALYMEYGMTIPELLTLDIGLRYNKSPLLQNSYFEPRIGLTTDITPDVKLKLSTSKNFQFVSQLVVFDDNELVLPSPIWIVSNNEEVPVLESNQWTGGILYNKDNWTIDLEAYVKEMSGLTSLTDPSISIPFSIAFPASYDQRHVLQWVNIYKAGKWDYSLGVSFKSGLPYTDALGVASGEIVYSDLNGARLPNYFKIDASIVYKFKRSSSGNAFVALSFQNILNTRNEFSRQYRLSDVNQLITRDEIGLKFTPNLSVNYSF